MKFYYVKILTIKIDYSWFYNNTVTDIVKVGLLLDRGMKERENILESAVT